MEIYTLEKSYRKEKKWMVRKEYPETGKFIHFGGKGYEDFPEHKDERRKENYLKRHAKNEDWTDLNKAGAWSRYVLWNQETIIASIKDMEKIFNIKIITCL